MKEKFYLVLVLASIFLVLCACSEKEVELAASSDVLFQVRTSEIEVEIKEGTSNASEINKIVTEKLKQKLHFSRGDVYEMKQIGSEQIDYYKSLDDFHKSKINKQGQYSFDPHEMYVTFEFDNESHTYFIDGYFGESFYNHFVHKDGVGEPHVVEATKIFCLHEDFLKEFQSEYPSLITACIKTDMITARRLETFK